MAVNVNKMLRKALAELELEKGRIEGQIAGIRQLLSPDGAVRPRGAARPRAPRPRKGKGMSAAARKALSRRMKAYWAKRRGEVVKGKRGGKK